MIQDSYNAANRRTQETYIDHSGVECDVRTGLPVGTRTTRTAAKPATMGSNGYNDDYDEGFTPGQHGGSGYGFFDAGGGQGDPAGAAKADDEEGSAHRRNTSRHLSVGRRLLDADAA